MTDQAPARFDRDEEHLKLLGIGHYVMAGLDLLGCGAGALYIAMALFLPAVIRGSGDPDVPEHLAGGIGVAMGAIGLAVALFSVLMAGLTAYAGWSLHNRRNRTLILVVSAFHLISMPFGTLLGVFTIMVLSRPSVNARFEARSP